MHLFLQVLGIIFIVILILIGVAFYYFKQDMYDENLSGNESFDDIKKVKDLSKRDLIAADYGKALVNDDVIRLTLIEKRVKQIIVEQETA